ncbi:MAG: alpha-L-fucosidase, partial [Paramuribaculum sp.]|nr:alpha-L-fucosidase [Paramuribaculum sp.]
MWGYKIMDQDYKDADTLIHLIVKGAGKGANLLLNIGPQPDGSLPAEALKRLKSIGLWMDNYGPTIYATDGGDFAEQPWGTTTRRGDTVFVHVLDPAATTVELPVKYKVKKARHFLSGNPVKVTARGETTLVEVPQATGETDCVIELILK